MAGLMPRRGRRAACRELSSHSLPRCGHLPESEDCDSTGLKFLGLLLEFPTHQRFSSHKKAPSALQLSPLTERQNRKCRPPSPLTHNTPLPMHTTPPLGTSWHYLLKDSELSKQNLPGWVWIQTNSAFGPVPQTSQQDMELKDQLRMEA